MLYYSHTIIRKYQVETHRKRLNLLKKDMFQDKR